jgi:hypothetical protein
MNPPDQGLDRERIEKLAYQILLPIRANYLAGPTSRDRVFEALNAMAFVTAVVIAGTEDDSGEALEFFNNAFRIASNDQFIQDLINKTP